MEALINEIVVFVKDPVCHPPSLGDDGALSALESSEQSQYVNIGELRTELKCKSGASYRGRGVANWVKERDWEQFHSPKNLAMDLASEVGELVEHFRWLSEEDSYDADTSGVREEIGDVFSSIVYLAHRFGIDPIEAARDKLKLTAKRYPVEITKGRAGKYMVCPG